MAASRKDWYTLRRAVSGELIEWSYSSAVHLGLGIAPMHAGDWLTQAAQPMRGTG
jgi:hypothetical protein